jgi:hypothetical protein
MDLRSTGPFLVLHLRRQRSNMLCPNRSLAIENSRLNYAESQLRGDRHHAVYQHVGKRSRTFSGRFDNPERRSALL